jgi:circadian clock protein KaiC
MSLKKENSSSEKNPPHLLFSKDPKKQSNMETHFFNMGNRLKSAEQKLADIKETKDVTRKEYVSSIFENGDEGKHFYNVLQEKVDATRKIEAAKNPTPITVQMPVQQGMPTFQSPSALDNEQTSRVIREAIELAKEVVSSNRNRPMASRASSAPSEKEQLFSFSGADEEEEEPLPQEPRPKSKTSDLESRELSLEKKELQEEKRMIQEERKKLEELQQKAKVKISEKFPDTKKQEVKVVEVKQQSSNESFEKELFEKKLALLEEKMKNSEQDKSEKKLYENPVYIDDVDPEVSSDKDRAQTGIEGMDEIVQGGFRRRSTNLVAGGPGSGKSIFGMQFLVNGATKYNEAGIYITFEESPSAIYSLCEQFNWDLKTLEKEKKLLILKLDPEQIGKLLEAGGGTLRDAIESIQAKRIVFDSMTDFLMLYKADIDKRSASTDLFTLLDKLDITTLAISEQEVDPLKHVSSVLEYQVDGVIILYNERIGHIRQRGLEIFKMRGTKHAGRIFPMVISSNGIMIRSNTTVS